MTISPNPNPTSPSLGRLFLLTGGAALAAGVIFAAFVLPVEFRRDPLGTGKLTGLDKLAGAKVVDAPAVAPGKSAAATVAKGAYRSDVISIPLGTFESGDGYELEYKVRMSAGDSMVYSWTVDVPDPQEFYYDFHGEKRPAPEQVVAEYRKASATSSSGTLTAPFDGIHGWYLQNSSAKPVVVKLRISGFYDLVPPGEPGNEAGIKAGG